MVADLRPGLFVGVTGKPDGTAVSIRIFPAVLSPRLSQSPMTGPQQGNIMTNAAIESFDGRILTVTAPGEKWQISVPADTEVLRPLPATFEDVAVGKRALTTGTLGPDDVLVAATVNLLG